MRAHHLVGAANGIFPEGRLADVPNTALVCIYYAVYEATHSIEYLMIERITP